MGFKVTVLGAVALFASFSLHAEAETRDVSTAAELVAALEELNNKDAGNVIRLAPGGYDVSPYTMMFFDKKYVKQASKSHIAAAKVRLVGTGATARDVVLYGDRSNCILIITGGGLENLTVSNAYTTATAGGGVQCTSGSGVVSSNVVVTCCTCKGTGGGVYNGTWYDSVICSNSVYSSHGGGVACGTYYNCVISNNYAKSNGGGVYYGVDLYDCTVVGNRSSSMGGGVSGSNADAGLCHVYGGLIAGNEGSSGGGASWTVFHGGTVVSNNTSTSDGASAGGGGIYIGDSTRADFVVDTVVCCNAAANMGGGIYVANTNAVVSNCLVRANTAETGGGIRSVGTVRDCVLAGNTATSHGGGLYATDGAESFGLTITNNTCAKNGGGAYVGAGGVVTNCLVCGNASETTGGGAYVIGLFADCVVSNNQSLKSSGGVFATKSGSVFGLVSNCLIACNCARTVGGGAYMDGGAALHACVISNNWCEGAADTDDVTVGGGGVRLYDGGRVYDSKVVLNWIRSNSKKSSCYGGGVYGAASCLVSNCLIAGNATYSGGKNVQGGGTYSGKLVDCVIRDNFLFGTLGMAMNSGSALRCVISNNASSASSPYSVRQVSSLTDCTICGAMTGAYVLDRCRVVNFTNRVYLAEGANVATSGWFNVGASLLNTYTAATNTLFADNYLGTTALFYGSGTNSVGLSLRFHNCTVADNVSGNIVRGSYTNIFENCIFARNRSSDGSLKSLTAEHPEVNAATNCVFWPACTEALGGRSACLDANPRFVDDGTGDSRQIKYASPARGQGLVRDWMDGANDLRGEGYPRKRDGLVDIGCYQCWLDPVGTLMLLR